MLGASPFRRRAASEFFEIPLVVRSARAAGGFVRFDVADQFATDLLGLREDLSLQKRLAGSKKPMRTRNDTPQLSDSSSESLVPSSGVKKPPG